MQYFHEKNLLKIANQLRLRIISKFAMDIVPGVVIGPGLRIEHPVGIVIGGSVRIGKNFTILQNSTLGERRIDQYSDGLGPVIGNEVTVCANAQILGHLTIANGTIVLGGAILLRNTVDNEIVKGVTA